MKQGWKTTEFWLGLFAVILVFLNDKLGLGLETQTIISMATVIMGYIGSRTIVKIKNGGKRECIH